MFFKRYVIQFITDTGTFYHCLGMPNDRTDISNALLMDEKALKVAIKKNCFTYKKVELPHRVIEVNCSIDI